MSSITFRRIVWAYYWNYGRHDLPWRKTKDPYKILVSEIMLQQTQVERVIPFYRNFLKQFPTVQTLANAPLADVLRAWQGLGYNRRAKMLHNAAKAVVKEYDGQFPMTHEGLLALPGVGPYTAGAVAAFAYNHNGIFIETNIRTAMAHHFFAKREKVSDKEIAEILMNVRPSEQDKSREWYSALMDYGAYLKKSGVKINSKSLHHTKQSKFAGSLRQARGAILRRLALGTASAVALNQLLEPARRSQLIKARQDLMAEKFISCQKRLYRLAR